MKTENISLLCRACLSSDDLETSFTSQLHAIYERITQSKITIEDKLPQTLCTTCSNKLKDISEFIDTCKLSEKYLKTLVENIDTNDENDTIQDLIDDTKEDVLQEETKVLHSVSNRQKSEQRTSHTSKVVKIGSPGICKRNSKNRVLQRHKKVNSEPKLFECKGCNKKFSQKSSLWRHFFTHTGDKPFECALCGKEATRKNQILDHIQKHHPNVTLEEYDNIITRREIPLLDVETQKTDLSVDSKIENRANDVESPLTEDESKVVDTKFEINAAENNDKVPDNEESNIKQSECNIKDEEYQVEGDNPTIKKKRLELCLCSLCGKQFKRNEYLRNHMATHMNIKPYTCSTCGAGFTQRQALSRHNLVHTKERPHKCTHCDKTFTRKEKLTDHIRCHEEGVPPHLCFHCGRRFKDREYLRKHLHYHLHGGKTRWRQESKRCLCPECGKEFHSESYLKKHMNIHTGEKPYTCEICERSFSVSAGLDYHMKIHKGVKPFKCTHLPCNKAFRTKYALKIHEKMHGNERPFRCTICSKGFVRNSHLKRHIKLHTDNSESLPLNT